VLGRPAAVYGPLVADSFGPQPPGEAQWRERLGGPRATVLMSAGAWGAGSGFARTMDVLRGDGYRPVVLCGRDERLRRRLAEVPGATALGWVDDMPGLLAASDVLLDNAAGQTALQALAVGVPVVGWRPIPGHGVEGVRRMAELGLSEHARSEAELLSALRRVVTDGQLREQRIAAGRKLLEADVVRPLESMLG
jgi:UDP-N-acetylglucosamine:LPS N-acetylglucosamine transferase